MSLSKLKRLANYSWCRERRAIGDDLDWLRIDDLKECYLPRPIILVTGAFDLLHIGHMRLLFAARDKAGLKGTVLCAMNSDESVQNRKGYGRPVMSWPERAAAIAYMPINVLVEFNTEDDLKRLVRFTNPDAQVAGPDYMNQPTTANIPTICVRESGMRTSVLIERLIKTSNIVRNENSL